MHTALTAAVIQATGSMPNPVIRVLIDAAAADLAAAVDRGTCARCLLPLPAYPCRSQVTWCRCVPICRSCAVHEDITEMTAVAVADHGSWLLDWPLDAECVRLDLRWQRRHTTHRA